MIQLFVSGLVGVGAGAVWAASGCGSVGGLKAAYFTPNAVHRANNCDCALALAFSWQKQMTLFLGTSLEGY
jgi:hypothetical protein